MLLSLEQFRNQIHYNPFHFWGWQNAATPVTSNCNPVVKQYSWQTQNAVGRNEIALAIEEAENRMRDFLGYSIAPHFVTDDIRKYSQFYDKKLWAMRPLDSSGHWKPVEAREGYVQAVGVEKLTKLATVNIVDNAIPPLFPFTDPTPAPPYLIYRDTDADGLADTFQVGLVTTVTDPSQIVVYFSSGDRLDGADAGERWRISPISVSISAGAVTIIGRSWMLSRPIKYEGVSAPDLNPATESNYAQSLDVYQRTCDSTGTTTDTSQGKFIWESLPFYSWWGIVGPMNNSTDPASQAYSVARVGIRNAKMGVLIPGEAIYDSANAQWNMTVPPWDGLLRPPDRVLVRYLAGYPLDSDGQVNRKFQTATARLAMAQLDNRIAGCEEAMRELYRWQRDLSTVADKTEEYRVSNMDLDCPWGTRRGAIDAWRQVMFLRLIRGVTNN